MSAWKVILVTVVIFGTGVVTGTLLAKRTAPAAAPQAPEPSISRRMDSGSKPELARRQSFLDRIQQELEITPDQETQIEQILCDGQVRTRKLWEEIAPQMKEEFNASQDQIREVLTPEQRDQFEKLLKKRRRPKHDKKSKEDDSACGLDLYPMAFPIDSLTEQPCSSQCDAPEKKSAT